MFEDVLYESEIAVCESMIACLDKANNIIEYAGVGDASDEYVMELFDIFMEATSRRKKADEIDEYMRKHNWGDVNAKTPAQAKKARQIRNFLIMQDFDPKTETIKSDDGKRRIRFNINSSGSNYHPFFNQINVDSKTPTGGTHNTRNLAITTHHEKGHEQFKADGKSKRWRDNNIPEDKSERGIKHIDAAKAQGKNINDHDDGSYTTHVLKFDNGVFHTVNGKQSPEELEADLHGAKNARVRTKYAGRKRAVKRSDATRHVTDKEIEKHFEKLANEIAYDLFNTEPSKDHQIMKYKNQLYMKTPIDYEKRVGLNISLGIEELSAFNNTIKKYKNVNTIDSNQLRELRENIARCLKCLSRFNISAGNIENAYNEMKKC